MPANSVPSENPLPGFQMAAFLLCPRRGWGEGEEREQLHHREGSDFIMDDLEPAKEIILYPI